MAKNKQQNNKRQPCLQYAGPDSWAKSGEQAMLAARMLCKQQYFNYACYVGQEALELYVKAFLFKCKPTLNPKCVGHETWKYLLKTTKERIESNTRTKQIKNKGQIIATFDNILKVFETKIEDGHGKQELWLKHISNPDTIKNDKVLFLKRPDKIKKKVGDAVENMKEESLYSVASQLIIDLHGEDMAESLSQTKTCPKLDPKMLEKAYKNGNKELVCEMISLLYSIYWLPTICAAYIHQQYARYPEKIIEKNQSCCHISSTSYNYEVTHALLDKIECTINEVKTHL